MIRTMIQILMRHSLLIFFLTVLGCTESQKTAYELLPPKEFSAKIEEVKQPVVLDVRTPEEVSEMRLANSINFDFHDPEFREKLGLLEKDRTYMVYCRSGRRSASTQEIMKELGFLRVYDLAGGIVVWQAEGLPIE